MKTYYIYEVQGVKVGCTVNVENRMQEQGYSNPIILEEHTDIYLASDREIELQKEKGYPVDTIPYWMAVRNRRKFNDEDRAKGLETLRSRYYGTEAHHENLKRIQSKAGLRGGSVSGKLKRTLTFEDAECIRAKFKTLDYLPTKIAKVRLLASEYSVLNGVIQGIIYNATYLTP